MNEKLRSVNTKFWDDPFIESLNSSEKLLFLYLLTNPLTNLLGIYQITIKRIVYDTGLKTETVQNGLESFGNHKKAFHTSDNYIILPNWLKNQRLNTNMKVAVAREFKELPKHLRDSILTNGSERLGNDSEGFRMIMESLGKYEIEIESEKESEKEEEKLNIPFDVFWDLYDKKEDREKCFRKWKALKPEERELCINRLPDYIKATPNKQYRRNPETYLNNKSWENEIIKDKKEESFTGYIIKD